MSLMFTKRGWDMYRCPSCHLVSTNLKQSYEPFVRKFYRKGYFRGEEECGAYAQYEEDKRFITRNWNHHTKVIAQYKKKGKLLDIGCAMGFFMELMSEKGFDVYGFDPSDFAVSRAPKFLNSHIQVGTITSVTYPKESFDVITMLDVFEHLEDPVGNLKKVYSWLKKDGILLVATGDTNSVAAKILREHWTFFTPPQHIHCFNKVGIRTVLSRSGFMPVTWYRIGKWLSLAYIFHLAATSADWPGLGFLNRLIKKLGVESVPVYLPMYDNIAVVARKK